MNILLKKVRVKTLFSRFEPIKVEPLELSYLKTICDEMGHKTYILDELFNEEKIGVLASISKNLCRVILRRTELTSLTNNLGFIPNIIVLTGYNVAENRILEEAKEYKAIYPDAEIIVGGLHIQLNASSFHKDYIDYVIHSQSLEVFRNIIRIISKEKSIKALDESVNELVPDAAYELGIPRGYDYGIHNDWILGSKLVIDKTEDIYPSREFLYSNKDKFHYLDKNDLALIKGSIGCPYKCSYCYCRELNEGKYLSSDYSRMIQEMCEIEAQYFWIVDDVLFVNDKDVNEFISQANKQSFNKKFIAYLRADFIIKEEDKLALLKEVGLDEIIIGFEAITESELKNYNKGVNPLNFPKVISILKEKGIDYTALFMVGPEYGIKDFLNLYRFIRDNDIEIFTLSVFTPIKGTKGYGDYNLVTDDPEKFDFLHLVTKSHLPKPLFYLLFYGMHLRMLKSKRIWKLLIRRKNEHMGFLG